MVEQLSIQEFERLLSRGRGKAILHLQQHDAAPYREVIRRCCLTNTAYDPQTEGTRATYLMQVIELSGDEDAICESAIQALHAQTQYTHDFDRLFALLGQFAKNGFQIARQAMYAWCRIHYDPQASEPGSLYPVVEVDGIQAFLFLLDPRQSGHYFDMDSDDYDDFGYFLGNLETDLGKDETRIAFEAATQDQSALRDTIARIYARRQAEEEARIQRRAEPQKPDWTDLAYKDVLHLLETGELRETASLYLFQKWAQKASEEDLYEAAVDFTNQTLSLSRMSVYVGIFQKTAFPLGDFSRFFDLARRIDLEEEPFFISRLPVLAINALENISHPQIRAFALELITNRQDTGRVVSLLANNFEDGDWLLVESLFEADLDEHDYHSLGFSIRDIVEQHPSPDAVPSLIRLFDANPCSHCRERVVESLVSLDALPDWIAEECRYDSNLDLRAYAERGFIDAPDD